MTVRTPKDIVVRASGKVVSEDLSHDNYRETKFRMDIPVQSYLVALVAGNLAEKKVGPRTYVITEPKDLEKAAKEFEDLEDSLTKAEQYLFPYEWGDYKLVILPPSFPFGGMENPLLTFASPSIVVGDKSSIFVGTHEIAHSWTGNLVTNMNWSNFWLNEGCTVFTERKVTEKQYGKDFVKVAAKLANYSMIDAMNGYGMDHSYSSLTPILNGHNPDDAFSTIPYEKGYQFLYYLETLVGEETFRNFFVSYLKRNSKHSITVEQFQDEFARVVFEEYSYTEAQKIFEEIDWKTWIETPGIPPVIDDFETADYAAAVAMADFYVKEKKGPEDKAKYHDWYLNLKNIFLQRLLEHGDAIDHDLAALLDSDMNMHSEKNSEALTLWFQVAIKAKYHTAPFEIED